MFFINCCELLAKSKEHPGNFSFDEISFHVSLSKDPFTVYDTRMSKIEQNIK